MYCVIFCVDSVKKMHQSHFLQELRLQCCDGLFPRVTTTGRTITEKRAATALHRYLKGHVLDPS